MKSKFTLALIALVGLLFAVPAEAQYARYTMGQSGGTTTGVAASTTASSLTLAVPATQAPDIGVQVSFKLAGAGTTAVTLKFDESVDNVNWKSQTRTMSITPSGTTTVIGLTNFTVGGVGYMRLSYVDNQNASALTNLTVKYAQKIAP